MQTQTSTPAGEQPWPRPAIAWYAVVILVIAFIFSFIDRIIIAMLVEPLKQDLGLTDTQIGWLQGLAFAVFYAAVGLPIGRWADRYSRRTIIGWGIFLWSLMTAVCGLARNFLELFLARVGVGVGQAALSPAAYSMIADYFPREKLGRAIGVYQAGAFFGAGLSFLVGGLVIQLVGKAGELSLPLVGSVQPWQAVFFVVGLPGILVALLMLTVREPARRGKLAGHAAGIPLGTVLRYAVERWRVFVLHFIGFALLAVPITTIVTWAFAFFTRVLAFTPPQAALRLGGILVILSPLGVYAGGWLADALQRRGYRDAPLRVALIAAAALWPLSALATTATDPGLVLLLFCPFVFFASLSMAMAPAALQLVAPNQMRAQISATWMLVLNLVTAGVGPTAVGAITDFYFGDPLAVGQSMALVNCISVPLAALALWAALAPFRKAAEEQAGSG
ncbi:MAG: MFS transporter [Gammaproteobacteria bacterium]|nr:MFS transporter [Gammaproteobacteria bacterium]